MAYTSGMQTDHAEPGTGPLTAASALPPPGEQRRLDLRRRRAIITSDRIDIRPSRAAIMPPMAGFLLGAGCIGLIVLGVTSNAISFWLLAILLLIALISVPLTGITLIYALLGANVIFDRSKQSGTWQQGLLGMGIGTTELVPFWKIEAIVVAEAGDPHGSPGRPAEEFAQWEAVLLKQSGKRLPIAGMTVPRQFSRAGYASVKELADAIAALTGATVRVETAPTSEALHADTFAQDEVVNAAPRRRSTPRRRTKSGRRS